jgi:hypothetical protein
MSDSFPPSYASGSAACHTLSLTMMAAAAAPARWFEPHDRDVAPAHPKVKQYASAPPSRNSISTRRSRTEPGSRMSWYRR